MKLSADDTNSICLGIALIMGLFKYSKVENSYKPFLYYIAVCFLTDMVSIVLINLYQNNLIAVNITLLLEFILISYQFKCWGLFNRKPTLFYILNSIVGLSFITEVIRNGSLWTLYSYTRGVYSFLIVILSIQQLNQLLFKEGKGLFLDSKFIICNSLIINYTLLLLVGVFINFNFSASLSFYQKILLLHTPINAFVNVLFAYAIFKMPERKKFLSIDK
ncbi:hypothetical protein C3K47_06670 [Solitalea longa]|uniref:Uncharacterized protein n=1 Tax=Solitalea longa TaxID=2079460 RepID=A0A2S5A4C7_9SPHI|nr:hypothetical protein [Solitalea longa]POY37440.1 hypothetical protein C3K47_06670 [Solitalea longa]